MPSTRAKTPAAGKPATGRPPLKNPLRTPAIGATASSSVPAFDDESSSVAVDRYAKDMQVARAVKAKRARGDMY